MSGYQVFNENGAVVIDSNYFGTYFRDSVNLYTQPDTGNFSLDTLLGSDSDMAYLNGLVETPLDENLKWYKFGNGGKAMLAGGYQPLVTKNVPGRMARTSSNISIQSGYRNVYNAQGRLVWSAVAAATIPRIIGFFDIPQNYNLDSQIYSQYIGTNTWLLASACPGLFAFGDPEAGNSTSISSLFFRFNDGTLSVCWATRNALTWAQHLRQYGLRIPYAILPNLN